MLPLKARRLNLFAIPSLLNASYPIPRLVTTSIQTAGAANSRFSPGFANAKRQQHSISSFWLTPCNSYQSLKQSNGSIQCDNHHRQHRQPGLCPCAYSCDLLSRPFPPFAHVPQYRRRSCCCSQRVPEIKISESLLWEPRSIGFRCCESFRWTDHAASRCWGVAPLIGGGIVNSAAFMTFARDSRTKTGLDIMYTINVLAPVLLVRSLLPVLAGKEGVEGTTAVNVASAAHAVGRLDYFRQQEEQKRSGKSSHKG